jgi:hypothetical protein
MKTFWVAFWWLVIVYLWQEFTWAVLKEAGRDNWQKFTRKVLKGRKLRVSNKNNRFFGKVELV